ncbi:hypothetical protein ALP39_200487 [Pseudomonas marginalis pv. marginalis]|nr:hypothetical protein ALP39_200487 [Pseudomonas marginalis pv. marginalis]
MFPQACGRHVAFGAHHRGQRGAGGGLRQAGDLPTDALERQLGAGGKALDLRGARQHHHWCSGQQRLTFPGLPVAVDFAQFEHLVVGQHLNPRLLRLPLAERRRMNPATLGEKHPARGQGNAGLNLGLVFIQQMQQFRRERLGQLRLAFGLLGIEGQLQHAAAVPIHPAMQVLQQAPGMAEPADYHLRQGRAVGR